MKSSCRVLNFKSNEALNTLSIIDKIVDQLQHDPENAAKIVGDFVSPTFRGLGFYRFGTALNQNEKIRLINHAISLASNDESKIKALKQLQEFVKHPPLTQSKVVRHSSYIRDFGLDFVKNNNFIPIFSPEINSKIVGEVRKAIVSHTRFDVKLGPITSQELLTNSIKDHKNELLTTLYEWCVQEAPLDTRQKVGDFPPTLTSWNEDTAAKYRSLMFLAKSIIEKRLAAESSDTFKYKEWTAEVRHNLVDPITAFYVLLNYDECVSKFAPGIVFDMSYAGCIDPLLNKYYIENQSNKLGSYEEDFADMDADERASKLLQTFTGVVQLSNGSFLDTGFLQQFKVGIQDLIENTSLLDFLTEGDFTRELLFNALRGDDVKKAMTMRVSEEAYNAFIDALEEFNKHLPKTDTSNPDFAKEASVTQDQDVVQAFIDALLNEHANTFVATTPTGDIQVDSGLSKDRSKIGIRSAIRNAVKTQILDHKFYKYTTDYVVSDNYDWSNFDNVYDPNLLRELSRITGIELSTERIKKLIASDAGMTKFSNFLKAFLKLVYNHFSAIATQNNIDEAKLEPILDRFVEELKITPEFIDFTNLLVEDNNVVSLKLQNQSGDDIPILGTNTVTNNFKKNWKTFVQQVPQNVKENNLLWKLGFNQSPENNALVKHLRYGKVKQSNPMVLHMVWTGDYAFTNSKGALVVVKPTDLAVKELATAGIGIDYLNFYMKTGCILIQPEAYSDKIRIAKAMWNLENNPEFMNQSADGIRREGWLLHQAYYQALEQDILSFGQKIFGITASNIKDFGKLLELQGSFTNADAAQQFVARKVAEYQATHPDDRTEFLNELHFSVKENKSGQYQLSVNSTIAYKVAQADDENLYNSARDKGFQAFFNSFKKNEVTIPQNVLNAIKVACQNEDAVTVTRLYLLFGLQYDESDGAAGQKLLKILGNGRGDIIFDFNKLEWQRFLRKYYEVNGALRDADILIALKPMHIHGKDASKLLSDDLNFADPNVIQTLEKDESERLKKGKKRMNFASASFSAWSLNTRYGVPKNVRVATIEHATQSVENYFGTKETLKTHDGAIFSTGVFRHFELNSYNGHQVPLTNKIIMLHPTAFGARQIKCADYTLTNELIRGMIAYDPEHNPQGFDGLKLMKRMLGDSFYQQDASGNWVVNPGMQTFLDNWEQAGFTKGLYGIFQRIGGKIYQLESISRNNNVLNFKWVSEDNVNDFREISSEINTLYDLWLAFGGAYSMDVTEDGFEYSENSQALLADLVSTYNPDLKEVMIGKMIDIEADKSSQGCQNAITDVFGDGIHRLATNLISTRNYGIQQDYHHEGEDSEIPALTQVLNAIGFNGQNIDVAEDAYKTLAKITKDALSEFTEKWLSGDKTDFHKYMAKELMRALQTNSLSSSAQVVVQDALKQLQATKTLPYSNSQIYYLATSIIFSTLNSSTIKQRFAGVAVIQNPANGIIGVYEDVNGVVHKGEDVQKMAEEWAAKKGLVLDSAGNYYTHEQIRELYLLADDCPFNQTVPVTRQDLLNIGAWVMDNGVLTQITSPAVMRQIWNDVMTGIEVTQVFNRPRDLATTRISFIENDQVMNFWLLESTLALSQLGKPGKTAEEKRQYDIRQKQLLRWQQANLKGLSDEEGPYYYKTFDDFKHSLNGNPLMYRTYVSNVQYRGGEEILPKQYKTAMGLDGSFAEISKEGAKYFETVIKRRYLQDATLPKISKELEVIACNDYDIVIVKRTAETDLSRVNTTTDDSGNLYDPWGRRINDINVRSLPNVNIEITKEPGASKSLMIVYMQADQFDAADFDKKVLTAFNKVANTYFGSRLKTYNRHFDPDNEDVSIARLCNDMYNSWKLTCRTISARIPSLAFQSFLANETVGYTNTLDNNGYMNVWEMWFQGSDYDIDKAYTMMWELDSRGRIAGNAFTDYSSPDAIQESFSLPLPDNQHIINDKNATEPTTDVTALVTSLQVSLTAEPDGVKRMRSVKKFLNELNKVTNPVVVTEDENVNNLVRKINNYQLGHESAASKRNRVMYAVRYAATNLRNLKAAEVPMEAKPVTSVINEEAEPVVGTEYYDADPFTIWKILKENSVGKKDVGIAANAIKAASSLQQYFNVQHKSGVITDAINIDLTFKDVTGKLISRSHIDTLANTVLSRQLFKDRMLANFQSDPNLLVQHPKYAVFVAFLSGTAFDGTPEQNAYYRLLSVQQQLGINYTLSQDGFLDSLYDCQDYQENVADTLSIFISLATDNAKELALAKIYGREELLSMPLTMITLGMDIHEVVRICNKLLKPISDALDINRFTGARKPDIRKFIQDAKVTDATGKQSALYDKETRDSLLKIYDIAQEFRMLTQFFKVNQGVTPKYAELSAFLRSLSKQYMFATGKKQPLNFQKLFTDPNYQNTVIEDYEKRKSGFNIMRIIFGTLHFRAQLESIAATLNIVENMSFAANMVSEFTHEGEMSINDTGKADGEKAEYKGQSSDIKYAQKLTKLANQFVISKGLANMLGLTFLKENATKMFKDWNPNLVNATPISIHTAAGINRFLDFMNLAVFPYLFEHYGDNFFVLNLITKSDYYTKMPYWDLNLDSFEARKDPVIAESINKAAAAYEDFAYKQTGIRTIDGTELSLGDLLYLYNMVTSRNALKGSTTCIYNFAKNENPRNPITRFIDDAYSEMDRVTQLASFDERSAEVMAAQAQLDTWKKQFTPFAEALKNTSGTADINGVHYDLNKNFILVMDPGVDVQKTTFSISNVKKFLEKQLVGVLNLEVTLTKGKNKSITVRMLDMEGRMYPDLTFYVTNSDNLDNILIGTLNSIAYELLATLGNVASLLNRAFKGEGTFASKKKLSEFTLNDGSTWQLPTALKTLIDATNPAFNQDFADWYNNFEFPVIVDCNNRSNSTLIHVEICGQQPFLFINSAHTNIDSSEFANSVIDAYFQSKVDHPLTDMEKLQMSLAVIYPLHAIDGKIPVERIKSILQDLSFKLYVSSSNNPLVNYVAALSVNENIHYLKSVARKNLSLFTNPLQHLDIYYEPADNNSPDKEGDIFYDKSSMMALALNIVDAYNLLVTVTLDNVDDFANRWNAPYRTQYNQYKAAHPEEVAEAEHLANLQWICLGNIDGKNVYTRIENLHNLSVPVVQTRFLLNKESFVKTKSLKYSRNLAIRPLSHTSFSYSNSYIATIKISDVNIGDKLRFKHNNILEEYFVLDILYERKNGTISPVLIGYRLRNAYWHGAHALIKIPLPTNFEKTSPDNLPSVNSTAVDNFVKILPSFSSFVKTRLFNSLRVHNKVKINNDVYTIDRLYDRAENINDTIIQVRDQNGQILAVIFGALTDITMDSIAELDSGFLQNSHTVVMKYDLDEEINYRHPLLIDGYTVSEDRKRNTKSVYPQMTIHQPNGQIYTVPKVNLGDVLMQGLLTDDVPIERNDYLCGPMNFDNKSYVVGMKVLDIDGTNATILYQSVYSWGQNRYDSNKWGYQSDRTRFGVKVIPLSDLQSTASSYKGVMHYKPNLRGNYRAVVQNNSAKPVSLNEAGETLLDTLSKRFGTQVKLVGNNVLNGAFARVIGGTVYINTDLYEKYKTDNKTDITIEQYVASQAVHEFTHLILADMRVKSPELYQRLVTQMLELMSNPRYKKVFDSNIYATDQSRVDETIADAVEQCMRDENIPDAANINQIVANAFKQVFNIDVNSANAWSPIGNFFQNQFNEGLNLDIQSIKAKYLSDQLLNNIKCE